VFISLVAAGVMFFLSPVQSSRPVLVSMSVLFLTPAVFLLGWLLGMSCFAKVCDGYRIAIQPPRVTYLLPMLFTTIIAIGLLGEGYWWFFSFAVAFMGHRKGTRRAYISEVTNLAFCLRSRPFPGLLEPQSDEDALAQATELVNKEIGFKANVIT
jgi:hypothetical protein